MTSSLEDELALRYQQKGDRGDFEALCRLLLPALQRHLLVLTRGHRHDAEDLQQEVLMALYHSLPEFRFQSSVKTWVWRLTHNVAVGQMRSWMRRRAREDRHHRAEAPLKPTEDPQQEVEKNFEVLRVRAALNRLGEQERSLIYLKEMEGLSMEDLALVFQAPVGTIKSRLFRAKSSLAKALEQEDRHG